MGLLEAEHYGYKILYVFKGRLSNYGREIN